MVILKKKALDTVYKKQPLKKGGSLFLCVVWQVFVARSFTINSSTAMKEQDVDIDIVSEKYTSIVILFFYFFYSISQFLFEKGRLLFPNDLLRENENNYCLQVAIFLPREMSGYDSYPPPPPLSGKMMSSEGADMEVKEEKFDNEFAEEVKQVEDASDEKIVPKEREITMEEAIFAFYDSERQYVENLKNGYHHFQHRLTIMAKRNNPVLSEKEILSIFGVFKTIGDANQSFLEDLIKLGGLPAIRDGIGEEMKKFGPYLKLYSEYIDNVKTGVGRLDQLKKKSKKFVDFLEVSEELCGRSLQSYLEEPIKSSLRTCSC
ncbi:guanine nucleotide exchange factor [Reticulomyxa filosa]|uniref:Guanine nucleotide exchange factor n=1 Tax=Reticulomyxa filosa TaxID=46433 RepID=X6N686_RETFI|nr:guanine nucleotide exchange factor [Reticulomyxa filosa]|eukprot:ETO21795.1 guanine nucleotide exchange factor [Reticulomyxa filosa]